MKMLRTKTLEAILQNPNWRLEKETNRLWIKTHTYYQLGYQNVLDRCLPLKVSIHTLNCNGKCYQIDTSIVHEDLVEEIWEEEC